MKMKMRIKEFAHFTGVSVRTLHYYDEIGLLKPAVVDEQTGYRFYDEQSLERMQEILFYRELDFSLKSICAILASPNYDKEQALKEQKRLLILKKERLERIIEALEQHEKGENLMKAFDNTEFETMRTQYEEEAKEKWGNTEAYAQYADKAKGYSKENYNAVLAGMEDIFAQFARYMEDGLKPDVPKVQQQVKMLQDYITEHFYHCTNQILAGLGKMYVADERFRNNIDKHAAGTADYVSEAIRVYCK